MLFFVVGMTCNIYETLTQEKVLAILLSASVGPQFCFWSVWQCGRLMQRRNFCCFVFLFVFFFLFCFVSTQSLRDGLKTKHRVPLGS